jgi:hypothetical protein
VSWVSLAACESPPWGCHAAAWRTIAKWHATICDVPMRCQKGPSASVAARAVRTPAECKKKKVWQDTMHAMYHVMMYHASADGPATASSGGQGRGQDVPHVNQGLLQARHEALVVHARPR